MKKILFTSLIALSSISAFATGGFYCVTETNELLLEVSATTPRSFGAVLIEPTAIKLVQKNSAIPAELKSVDFSIKEIPQYWNSNDELKVLAYKENFDLDYNNVVTVMMETKYDEVSGKYVGNYTVKTDVNDNKFEISGPITCDQE